MAKAEPTVSCVDCERTFYAHKFKGTFLPKAKGICQWCLDPTLSLLEDEHEIEPEPEAEEAD